METSMSKKCAMKQPLLISGNRAKKALAIGLDHYLQSVGYKTAIHEYAGSIDFTDEEFSAMLQELKEDK
jgi:hypothetical protein